MIRFLQEKRDFMLEFSCRKMIAFFFQKGFIQSDACGEAIELCTTYIILAFKNAWALFIKPEGRRMCCESIAILCRYL